MADEVQQVRDELRSAVRQLDTVTQAIVLAIDHAQRLIDGGGPSSEPKTPAQRMRTPAAEPDLPRFLRE